MASLKTLMKTAVEVGLGSVLGPIRHRLNRKRALILAFHNVLPEDAPLRGDRSLHLGFRKFKRFLDVLEDLCAVTTLGELLQAENTKKPPVALTFDDAYAGALEVALPELTRRKLPATVFVCPGLLGASGFWWDRLAGPRGLAGHVRRKGLGELRGEGDAILQWATGKKIHPTSLPRPYAPVTEAGLAEAVEGHDVTLGIHTWDHPRLDRLSDAEIRNQLARTWSWLRDRFPKESIPWVCYPYGHYDDRVVAICQDLGFSGGLRVRGGWVRNSTDTYALPRLTIPAGLSVPGFRLRVTGLIER